MPTQAEYNQPPPAGEPLERVAAGVVEDARYWSGVRGRDTALRTLWRVSSIDRVRACMRFANGEGLSFRLRGTPGEPGTRAGIAGVQTCGSVWSCPVCAEKINHARRDEITAGIDAWRAQGGTVMLATFTAQHSRTMALADLLEQTAGAWRRMLQSVAWRGGRRSDGLWAWYGLEGYARLLEVTHGTNGWHPHFHVLLFAQGDTDAWPASRRGALEGELYGVWSDQLGKVGLRAARRVRGSSVGVDVRLVDGDDAETLGDYLTKHEYRAGGAAAKHDPKQTGATGAAFEVTSSHRKTAGKGRTPMQILADVVAEDGDLAEIAPGEWVVKGTGEVVTAARVKAHRESLALWHEWEKATKGRRQLTWSVGFRKRLGLGEAKSDEDIAEAAELDGDEIELEAPITHIMSFRGHAPFPRSTARDGVLLKNAPLRARSGHIASSRLMRCSPAPRDAAGLRPIVTRHPVGASA